MRENENKDLQRKLKLNSLQIQELQHLVKRCLGKDLSTEESMKLFDSDVESFIKNLNLMVYQTNQKKITQSHRDLIEAKQTKKEEVTEDLDEELE